jgi:hypothetical protein
MGSTLHESLPGVRFTGRLLSRPSISSAQLPKQNGHRGLLLNEINGTGANIAA